MQTNKCLPFPQPVSLERVAVPPLAPVAVPLEQHVIDGLRAKKSRQAHSGIRQVCSGRSSGQSGRQQHVIAQRA